ncbi:sigma-70 family RNA polymerase sigma factor [Flavitalea sp. BT771]|uniref:RNA polymerase sigma factor n=1 Tax=Flavitalea sp. BT771 TaxID=3063329 RepID=UPI0026E1F40C|nr:sigma-70 family RNA polymerase sigma factor [Flavitalea sp. BT771]MDO6435659.1 sigma-70 family RNA polymerase sigma factor [Flavitalea sp. BT771]MDV6224560.1 sigma-70 family RNA polymerase sigma factor [Flavitalea sp. BT771]
MTAAEQQHIFESWLSQYKGLFFKIVRAYAVSGPELDDLFQEIVIQVWKSVPAFRGESAVSTWVYRIAINAALSWVRKEGRHRAMEDIGKAAFVLQEGIGQADERVAWLYAEIHRMDEIDRSIALLLLEGFSYKEMAAILGITESNVGVKINRIKKRLIATSKKQDCYGI